VDLNKLYFDHQILLMRADGTEQAGERARHMHGAALVAGRIGCMQRAVGADAADGWSAFAANDGDVNGPWQPCLTAGAGGAA